MTEEKKDWKMAETPQMEKMVLKRGRYRCKLLPYVPLQTPSYEDKSVLVDTLLMIFEPTGITPPKGKTCSITALVTPTRGKKSNFRKILTQIAPEGFIPESAEASADAWKAFAESLVGSYFDVTSEPSNNGKHNNFASGCYSHDQSTPAEPLNKQAKKVDDMPALDVSSTEDEEFKFYYDLSALEQVDLHNAILEGKKFQASFNHEEKLLGCNILIAALKKYVIGAIPKDEIEF